MHITPHANGEPLLKRELLTFTFFLSSATILLVVWSDNGDGIVLLLPWQVPRSVTILADGIERPITVSSFGQIEQGAH